MDNQIMSDELKKIAISLRQYEVRREIKDNIQEINGIQNFAEYLVKKRDFSKGMKRNTLRRISAHLATARKELQDLLELYDKEQV